MSVVAQLVKRTAASQPTVVVVRQSPGNEDTICVGRVGKPTEGLVGKPADWLRLFTNDKDGDLSAFELFKALYERLDDDQRDQLMNGVAELYEAVAEFEFVPKV
jgi:hypothetical protein